MGLSSTQAKVLNKFRKELEKFLQGPLRNLYVESGRSISVYTRKGIHYINGKKRTTLDIANISVGRPGKGLGMATVDLMHEMNPFEVTHVESILNKGFENRLIKEGWLIIQNSNPTSVYKEK